MISSPSMRNRHEGGTKSAHSLGLSGLPFHDPAGGWIAAEGECPVATAPGAESSDRHPGERTEA